MKVGWLNDALMFRCENDKERQALAVMYESLEPKEPADLPSSGVEQSATSPLKE